MDYIKLYNAIIINAKFRENKPDCYCERHHIIPKCIGGTNDKNNLVVLTAKEHYIVHHLLIKIFPTNNKIFFAFNAMNMIKRWNSDNIRYIPKISSKEYEKLKIERSKFISKCLKGVSKSEEHCKHLSESISGRKLSFEHKEHIRQSNKKVIHTKEWNKKVSDGKKKYKCTQEHALAISKGKKGKHIHYNMKSAGFMLKQNGINNYQAIKCYVNYHFPKGKWLPFSFSNIYHRQRQ